jgi:glycosyltransferase involved in cell wall biosynthesis/ubiquinone/menaquinone biosynthesis C-methylase UbiE
MMSSRNEVELMSSEETQSRPESQQRGISAEFQRRLARYFGEIDSSSAFASVYSNWYKDHAGGRVEWLRIDMIWRMECARPLAGCRVLDLGCGTGSSSVVLAENGATVVGAETEQNSLEVAVQRATDHGVAHRCRFVRIPYLTMAQGALPFRDESFDACNLIGVLEHMKPRERQATTVEIRRVLKPGGTLFIFDTPNRAYPRAQHTTDLWFLGWMPVFLARRYAIIRRQFERNQDFQRYGGNGLSRTQIDRLFPSRAWRVTYEKSRHEVAYELGRLVRQSTVLPAAMKQAAEPWIIHLALKLLKVVQLLGCRPTYWTVSHALCLTKLPALAHDGDIFSFAKLGKYLASVTSKKVFADRKTAFADWYGQLLSKVFTSESFNDWRIWAEGRSANFLHRLQLRRLRADRWIAKRRGRRRVLTTACWSFPIYSQTFVYQELTQLLLNGFALRFLYCNLDSRKHLPAQFSRLWHARRRLILHPSVCQQDYAYFEKRMPTKIEELVTMLSTASRMPAQQLRSHYHFLQAFAFARMVEAYQPEYLHSYFFYEGTLFTFVASYLLDIPRGVSCYSDHMLDDYALKVVPLQLQQCRLVVATSARIKHELMKIAPAVDPSRIVMKPNAINAAHFPVINPKEPQDGQPYRLISLCRIEPKKGLMYLVEAVRLLRDRGINVEWHHLGAVDNSVSSKEYARELETRIKDLKLDGMVHLEGRKSESEIRTFFKRSHLFVAPFVETQHGDKDGIPTSLLEGMASGLPVVGTDAGSIGEVVENAWDGVLVPQRNALALANAIETLLRNPIRRQALARHAADKIRRHFEVQVCENIFHERVRALMDATVPRES